MIGAAAGGAISGSAAPASCQPCLPSCSVQLVEWAPPGYFPCRQQAAHQWACMHATALSWPAPEPGASQAARVSSSPCCKAPMQPDNNLLLRRLACMHDQRQREPACHTVGGLLAAGCQWLHTMPAKVCVIVQKQQQDPAECGAADTLVQTVVGSSDCHVTPPPGDTPLGTTH